MVDGVNEQAVLAALESFPDPETGRSVVQQGQVRDVRIEGDRLSLVLALSTHSAPLANEVRERVPKLAGRAVQAVSRNRRRLGRPRAAGRKSWARSACSAKSVIAVGSGKGGVGKSTIAA